VCFFISLIHLLILFIRVLKYRYQKMNSLQDILYISEYARKEYAIKCTISC